MDANDLHLAAYRRALRSKNRSARTIQNYEEALGQLAGRHPGVDLMDLRAADIEDYIAAVLAMPPRRRRGRDPDHVSSAAAVRFRALRAFYNWAVAEEIIDRSPMARMKEPSATDVPIPVLPDDHLRALLKACAGKGFDDRRDTAIIRLFCEPGSPRVAEMAGLDVEDLDMRRDNIRVHGKGDKVRDIPFGPKTGQALDRYLRARRGHSRAALANLFIGLRGAITPSGIAQMLHRRCDQAGLDPIHPHQLRHTAAHVWADNGGSEVDAMELFGWASAEMPRRYGRSARTERAHRAARRTTMADRL